jgi:hypothetical protein
MRLAFSLILALGLASCQSPSRFSDLSHEPCIIAGNGGLYQGSIKSLCREADKRAASRAGKFFGFAAR